MDFEIITVRVSNQAARRSAGIGRKRYFVPIRKCVSAESERVKRNSEMASVSIRNPLINEPS
jgi:hypothetical protein